MPPPAVGKVTVIGNRDVYSGRLFRIYRAILVAVCAAASSGTVAAQQAQPSALRTIRTKNSSGCSARFAVPFASRSLRFAGCTKHCSMLSTLWLGRDIAPETRGVESLIRSGTDMLTPAGCPTLRPRILRERWRASRLPSFRRRFAALTRAMRSRILAIFRSVGRMMGRGTMRTKGRSATLASLCVDPGKGGLVCFHGRWVQRVVRPRLMLPPTQ